MCIFRCGVVGGSRFIALVGVIAFLGLLASPAPAAAQTQGVDHRHCDRYLWRSVARSHRCRDGSRAAGPSTRGCHE